MFPFSGRPSIFLGEEDQVMLQEVGACLQFKSYLTQINLTLTSVLGHTISTSTITLDQQLPSRLENYIMTPQINTNTWPNYISKLSLIQCDIDYNELQPYAQPLVIESKEEKQYQVIKTQSSRQVGFQQKKEDGLLSNQIIRKDSRSISPQPMSQLFAQSHAPETEQYNPNSSYQSSGKQQLDKWNDKPKEKILFQDRYIPEEEQQKSNRIIVKKSEDPQFFEQLKNARIASPSLRQVKGSGLSPEPQIKSKSKSPEIVQVNLPKNCKKWESKQESLKSNQPIKQPSQIKLPDHFKKLLNDSNRRQNMPKPFDSNNTKFSQKQQEIASQQINQAKTSSFLKQQLEDSQTDNQNSIPQDKQLPFKISYQEDLMNSDQYRSKSQNKKYENEKLLEQFRTQNQSIRDQFSFKPQFDQQKIEQPKIKAEQLVESRSLRGISPQNRSIQQQQIINQPPIPLNQQKEPIQIKLDIKQFMNSNKPQIQMARENGRNLYVNVNFHK